jgi:hypothetical protein
MGLADADLHGPFADGATRFPPTLFVHMPRDTVTAHAVARTVQLLRRAGTAALALEARALSLRHTTHAHRPQSSAASQVHHLAHSSCGELVCGSVGFAVEAPAQ